MNNNMNNNITRNNNTNKDEPPKGNIQRGERLLQFTENNRDGAMMVPIHLHASSGLNVVLNVPNSISMKELFQLYVRRIGISPNLLGKEIIFIFNALTINVNEEKSIAEYFAGTSNAMTITVVDRDNVIGANSIKIYLINLLLFKSI